METSIKAPTTHFIKARETGKRSAHFLTSKGALNRLRVHASMFTKENAILTIATLAADNPGWEFWITPIRRKPDAAALVMSLRKIKPMAGFISNAPIYNEAAEILGAWEACS